MMTYTPQMGSLSGRNAAYRIEQKDVQKVLNALVAKQSGGFSTDGTANALPGAVRKNSFEGWQRGQLDFARRLAKIALKHAARHKHKFCWKHHSISLLRRLALVVMVASILAAQYI